MLNRIVIVLLLTLSLFSCRKEEFYTGNEGVRFDTDTVWFDTVFTRMPGSTFPPSVVRTFVIYNPYSDWIKADISLAGGAASPFRLNIDGAAVNAVTDYEIRPKDSIYVFVQAKLDANNQSNPMLIMDSVRVRTNGRVQDVKLAAYGWDAHYYRDSIIECTDEWNDKQKPYVLLNHVLVKKGCVLKVGPGVKIYNGVNSSIFVEGSLQIGGTAAEPVMVQGSRLDADYRNIPGQWNGIHFLRGSVNNSLSFVTVKNGYDLVRIDSLPESGTWNLEMKNCFLLNAARIGLFGITAKVYAENCVSANCGSYTFIGYLGGDYDFRHCTFANYGGSTGRKDPSFVFNNIARSGNGATIATYNLKYNLQNSIIYGGLDEEIGFDVDPSKLTGTNLEKNLIRTKNTVIPQFNLVNKPPKFKNVNLNDYSLDTLSPAKDAGMQLTPPITADITGKLRDSKPDIGAYERQN